MWYVCRRYIQAAAYPKDVVILLDGSGSMKGLRIEIARATVAKILDTLTDDDFFNVIMVCTTFSSISDHAVRIPKGINGRYADPTFGFIVG
jgi:uncharacterized protein with von Willebrand factor type A (vWA) domain